MDEIEKGVCEKETELVNICCLKVSALNRKEAVASLRDGIFRIGQSQKRRKAVSKRQNILEGWVIISKVLEWRGRFRLRKKD